MHFSGRERLRVVEYQCTKSDERLVETYVNDFNWPEIWLLSVEKLEKLEKHRHSAAQASTRNMGGAQRLTVVRLGKDIGRKSYCVQFLFRSSKENVC